MEKIEPDEWQNCFICSEYMGPFKNDFSVPVSFSEKPIYQIFGKLQVEKSKHFEFTKFSFFNRILHESEDV